MRGRSALGLWLLAGACVPDAPTLNLTVSPKTLRRDQTATARVVAKMRPDVAGQGVVRLESDLGSLASGVDLELDEAGSASAKLSCLDPSPGCSTESISVTATWLRTPPVSSQTMVRLLMAAEPSSPDAGDDASIPPRWMDFQSGFFLEGSPTGAVMRRVFAPDGRILVTRYANELGRLFIDLDPSPGGDVFEFVWTMSVGAPRGQPLGVGMYSGATRFPGDTTPGLDLGGEGRRCNQSGGFFDVHELTPAPDGGVLGVTVTFEQWCEGDPTAFVRGWVRLPAPSP